MTSAAGWIEKTLDYRFRDNERLSQALTHRSAGGRHNERLEFLGDAILSIVICQKLFEKFRDYPEGELTKMKSMLVSRGTCAHVARRLGLPKFLVVGKGMASHKAFPTSLAAGLLEAVIAADSAEIGSPSSFTCYIADNDTAARVELEVLIFVPGHRDPVPGLSGRCCHVIHDIPPCPPLQWPHGQSDRWL